MEEQMAFCQNCGGELPVATKSCPKCSVGISAPSTANNISHKSWTATFFLCWFFGLLGVHRFYTGHIKSGIVQLLTLGCFSIWTTIDWFVILFGGFKDKLGNPVRPKKGEARPVVLVLIAVAGVLFIIIAANMGDSASDKSGYTYSGSYSPQKQEIVYSIGDTLTNGRMALLVTAIRERNSVGNEFLNTTPSEGATYVTVQYKYKNISSKAIGMFSKPNVTLLDPNGNDYDSDMAASSYFAAQIGQDEKVFSDLNPGISVKSSAVYEVSKEMYQKHGWKLSIDVDGKTFIVAAN
jgi:TM2 domain-containing membrane protein YozV